MTALIDGSEALVGGVELGGTKTIVVVARGHDILARREAPTVAPAECLHWANRRLLALQAEHGRLEALGVASFGPLDIAAGRIGDTPKPGWADAPVIELLAAGLTCPIAFDTDVAGAALAEGRWGGARGCQVHIYVTIGTGVGGGLVVDGRPVHGLSHPEMGHVRVRRTPGDAFAGVCPFHGDCLEGLASGPAIAARAGLPAHLVPEDDPVWSRVASELGEFMASLLLVAAPERIAIGGGVGANCGFLLPMIRSACATSLAGYGVAKDADLVDTVIVQTKLGADAGPLGAIALALARIER